MAAAAVVSMMPAPLNNKQQSSSSQRLPIATASGLLALLSEPDPTLVQHALSKLLLVVDTLWHEIAESLPDLETIAEGGQPNTTTADNDDNNNDANMADNNNNTAVVYDNSTRQKAAALASRVFFHLEEPRQALRLALESGSEYFNVLCPKVQDVAYVERLVNAAIGEYVKKRREEFDGGSSAAVGKSEDDDEEEELDMDKLQTVVHLMFERCYQDKHYGHALGVAFESMEKDKVEEILERLLSDDDENNVVTTLKYALQSAQTLITSKNFRLEALSLVASTLEKLLEQQTEKYSSSNSKEAACTLVLCRQLLGDADAVGKIITELIDTTSSSPSSSSGEDNGSDDTALLGLQLCFDIVDSGDEAFVTKVAKCLPKAEEGGNDDAAADTTSRSDTTLAYFTNAHRVLTGGFTSELSLSFLYKNSNFDKLIMTNLKKALEERSMSRNSVLHNCAVTAHGYLTAGTTNDSFLRDNLDWMKKASNWYVLFHFFHQHLISDTFHTTCLLTSTLPTCFIFYQGQVFCHRVHGSYPCQSYHRGHDTPRTVPSTISPS
jgi:26S proteasome regulatory subunit N2